MLGLASKVPGELVFSVEMVIELLAVLLQLQQAPDNFQGTLWPPPEYGRTPHNLFMSDPLLMGDDGTSKRAPPYHLVLSSVPTALF